MSSSVVKLESYSKKAVILKLLDLDYKSAWSKKLSSFEAEWNRSDTEPGWIVSKKYEDDLVQIIRESRRSRRPRNEENKYSRVKKHSRETDSHGKDEVSDKPRDKAKHSSSRDSSRSSESERDYSEEEDDESSEDELIQLALARKLKYESSQKVIEEDNIENSDLEDVISMCRRMRHLLQVNRQLSERVRDLEKRLQQTS